MAKSNIRTKLNLKKINQQVNSSTKFTSNEHVVNFENAIERINIFLTINTNKIQQANHFIIYNSLQYTNISEDYITIQQKHIG